jgi:hypothetical protein
MSGAGVLLLARREILQYPQSRQRRPLSEVGAFVRPLPSVFPHQAGRPHSVPKEGYACSARE